MHRKLSTIRSTACLYIFSVQYATKQVQNFRYSLGLADQICSLQFVFLVSVLSGSSPCHSAKPLEPVRARLMPMATDSAGSNELSMALALCPPCPALPDPALRCPASVLKGPIMLRQLSSSPKIFFLNARSRFIIEGNDSRMLCPRGEGGCEDATQCVLF